MISAYESYPKKKRAPSYSSFDLKTNSSLIDGNEAEELHR